MPDVPFMTRSKQIAVDHEPATGFGTEPTHWDRFDNNRILELPSKQDLAACLTKLALNGLEAEYGYKELPPSLRTLGDVICSLEPLSAESRSRQWGEWATQFPKLCIDLRPILDGLSTASGGIYFDTDCKPSAQFMSRWSDKRNPVNSLEWKTAQGVAIAIRKRSDQTGASPHSDAQVALNCMKTVDQDLDGYLRWNGLEYPYSDVSLITRPWRRPQDGTTTALIHYECRKGKTRWNLATRTKVTSDVSVVMDYYALSRRLQDDEAEAEDAFWWLAGRDTYIVINDENGRFVALFVVTAFGLDVVGAGQDPRQSVLENLGNLIPAAQIAWDGMRRR